MTKMVTNGGNTPQIGSGPGPTPMKVGTESYYRDRAADYTRRTGRKPPTYYLNYGNKYLNRFKHETYFTLSGDGQKWLEKTLFNLQQAIEDRLLLTADGATIEGNDDKFTTFAFSSHVPAYEDNNGTGVLTLSVMDKVRIGLTPDAADLFSDLGLKQVSQIASDQVNYYEHHWLFFISQGIEAFTHKGEINKLIDDYLLENQGFFNKMMKQNPQEWSNPKYKVMGIVRDILNPTFIL